MTSILNTLQDAWIRGEFVKEKEARREDEKEVRKEALQHSRGEKKFRETDRSYLIDSQITEPETKFSETR